MNAIKLLSLILMLTTSLFASPDKEKEAATLYKESRFEESKAIYLSLLSDHPKNPQILYNIGNTNIKLNLIGEAIGYYLKALKEDPGNPDIRYNLNLARNLTLQKKNDTNSVIQKLIGWTHLISLNITFYILMLCLLLLFILILIKKRLNKELASNAVIVACIACIISLSLFSYKILQFSEKKAVVIEKKIKAHSGPSPNLPVLFHVHDGNECKRKQETNNWTEIELKNGFKGWVKREKLIYI